MERKCSPSQLKYDPRYEGERDRQEVVVSDYFTNEVIKDADVRVWTDEAVGLGYLLEGGWLYNRQGDSYYKLKKRDVIPLPQMNPKEGEIEIKSKIVVDIPGEVNNFISRHLKGDFDGWTRKAIGLRLRAENMQLFRKKGRNFERILLSTQEE